MVPICARSRPIPRCHGCHNQTVPLPNGETAPACGGWDPEPFHARLLGTLRDGNPGTPAFVPYFNKKDGPKAAPDLIALGACDGSPTAAGYASGSIGASESSAAF
jgi:hypothetical protein